MSFKVTLQPSGHSFDVPAESSVLAAGLAAGFVLPYSCKTGVCRTCRGTVLEGRVDFGNVHPHYLTEEHKSQGLALLCQARPMTDLVVELKELSMESILPTIVPARVKQLSRLADDVIVIHLRLPLNENMRFAAGQYVDLLLDGGMRRSYSIGTAPDPEGVIDIELHVRHLPGGTFTDRLFRGDLKERAIVRFEGPQGTFFLREDSDKPVVLVASGTGFAPIKSLLEYAFGRGINSRRPMTLYWGGRRRADLYMFELASRWAAEEQNFRFIPVLSEPTAADAWLGRTGFVHRAVMADTPDLSSHQVYACGAPVMVDAARADFIARCGLSEEEFYADSFLTQADKAPA